LCARYLIEEGRAGQPKMMSVGLHCRLARPGRVAGLSDFIDFAKSYHRDVWICTREQIADFWYENHYPRGGGTPVKAEKDDTENTTNGAEQMATEDFEGDVI